jgi:hypothetical protein
MMAEELEFCSTDLDKWNYNEVWTFKIKIKKLDPLGYNLMK